MALVKSCHKYLQMREAFSIHTLQARQIAKYLQKTKSVHFFFIECKRQKVGRMSSLKYAPHHEAGQFSQAKLPTVSSLASITSQADETGQFIYFSLLKKFFFYLFLYLCESLLMVDDSNVLL